MIRNYFKIAWRNIRKSPVFSSINILGLSAGISFFLLISAYVWNELRVNKNLLHADRQYILQSKWKDPNLGLELTSLGPLAKALKENYPGLVANYFRWDGITSNVSKGDKSFREGLQLIDSTMFSMYGFKLLHGDPATALDGPYSLVITEDKAKKYFGRSDVVGETLSIENYVGSKHDFMITGVMEKPFRNSITFITEENDNQFYISSNNIAYFGRSMAWNNVYIVGYIELQKGISPGDLEAPMKQLIRDHAPPQFAEALTPYIVSLKDYYLSADNGLIRKMLFAMSAIAFFILLMAIVNFINISISRSSTRMREIGVRKVMGSLKRQLMIQFLAESIILVSFATVIALGIYSVARGVFSSMMGKNIPSLGEFPLYFIVFPLALIFLVGIVAGIYPAFVLSSLKAVESLKGKLTSVKENIWIRKSLVAFQFGTALIVFISAIIISAQTRLFFGTSLGFNKDYIVSAQLPRNWTPEGVRKAENLRQQFAMMQELSAVTLSYEVPDGNGSGNTSLYRAGADSTTAVTASMMMTDEYYSNTYDIPMAAGEFYSKPGAFTDSSKLVINETQAKALGWKDPAQAVGKQVRFPANDFLFTIAGVTKDFHFGSMQKTIQPITFLHVGVTNVYRMLSFKLKPGNIGSSIAALQKKWSALLPGTPFEYTFMDEKLEKIYRSELQLKKASYTASFLSLVIVLLGVIGLIALSIQRRTKEIGIRKVLGSSVKGIIALFLKDFLLVVLIAGMVACPVAYLLMKQWLNDYVYRVDITAVPFVIAMVVLAAVTALLIVIQTIRTAIASPVKSLRTE
jgi:ABC-type antimicrobial peptide transport system permease subunit